MSVSPVCPRCGCVEYSYLSTRRLWKCKKAGCRRQFSVKVGTIFEDSAIRLDKWLVAIWMLTSYFRAIPIELEEAAIISGGTR